MTATPDAAPLPPAGQAIDAAQAPEPPGQGTYDPALVRLEVLLDRAGFSPGVIDGRDGTNLQHALAAFAPAKGPAGQRRSRCGDL